MTDFFVHRAARWSADGLLRWTLERTWDLGPRLCYIGHNPAKAGADREDMTSMRWMHFGQAWEFGSYVAVNFYPFASADVAECRRWLSVPGRMPTLRENLEVIRAAASSADRVVACWGNLCLDHTWAEHVIATIQSDRKRPIYCFGTNADGSPKHVMARGRNRVPDTQQAVVWRAA